MAFVKPCFLYHDIQDEICDKYDEMNRRRKVFYGKSSLSSLFDDSIELVRVVFIFTAKATHFGLLA